MVGLVGNICAKAISNCGSAFIATLSTHLWHHHYRVSNQRDTVDTKRKGDKFALLFLHNSLSVSGKVEKEKDPPNLSRFSRREKERENGSGHPGNQPTSS